MTVKLSKKKNKIKFQMSRKDRETLQKIAHKITELRQIEAITQEELAKRMKTTQSVISRIESGKQNITIDYIQKIASALGRKISLKFINKSR
jgi:transcriptional regulator with XRE-family HTH domain